MTPACDILVAGAGVAGVPAAVAAARAGARTVLLEKEDFPGGAGVMALHRYICGLYLNGPDEPTETLNPGLPREITARLHSIDPANRPQPLGRVWGFAFQPAHFRAVYDSLLRDEPNLTVHFSASVESVTRDADRIASVTYSCPNGSATLHPAAAIDATGSGDLIRLSGAPFHLAPEPERQISGCTLHLGRIQGDRSFLGVRIAWTLSRFGPSESRDLPVFAGFSPGSASDDGFCKFSLHTALDEPTLSHRLKILHTLLAAHIPELATSRILAQSRRMEREGIRLAGQWELDAPSLLAARKFPDAVARTAWPIEFWDPASNSPRYDYPPDGDYAEIPRRCLCSSSIVNLLATGRCISATSRALAATRVMGTCIALGEAAGNEAATLLQPASTKL